MTEEPRSNAQNRRLWAMLGDLSRQLKWPVFFEGRPDLVKLCSEDWKNILSASLEKSQRMAQGIDGGYVLLGQRTSKMSVKKMTELLELVRFFGDSKQVKWSDPAEQAFIAHYQNEA